MSRARREDAAMQEEIREETEMGAVEIAQEAEALKILRMLDKAIKDGKNIEKFRDDLDAYIEGKVGK